MANTSATGGYLSPAANSPPEMDSDLDALFQAAVAAITGLPGNMVRPRWQAVAPVHPEPGTNWAAIGITEIVPDDTPSIQHTGQNVGQPEEVGYDTLARHELVSLLCTFYGPLGMQNAGLLRDGLGIPQNMAALTVNGIGFVDAGPIRQVPEIYNQQWIKRFDMLLQFRRKVARVYPILNILSVNFSKDLPWNEDQEWNEDDPFTKDVAWSETRVWSESDAFSYSGFFVTDTHTGE